MSFLFSQPAPGILPANSVDFSEVETIGPLTLLGNKLLGPNPSTIQELSVSDVSTMLNLAQYAIGPVSSVPTSIPVFSDNNGKILVDNSGWRINGSVLMPFADGAGDIGGSAIARPGEVWVKNRINLNSLSASSFAGSNGSKDLVSLSSATATSYLDNFGPDLGAGGTKGLVPAPAIGDATRYLRGDGTWAAAGVNTAGALDQQVLAYDSGTGLTTWQYAGLGDGSLGAGNVILGRSKPASLVGTNVTIVGDSSGTALTTGSSNVLLGKGAGSALTTGNYNTFVGNDAGSQQTTASNSVVVGQSNTIGTTAGLYYVLGNNNTCSGLGSISIGYAANAGTGRFNLTAGISSGATTNTGEFNIFMGTNCAYGSVSNANSNVCIGYDAARQLSTGNENLILGHGAGYSISSGTYNVALGYYAGSNIGSRTETVSLGRNAGGSNTGSYSVFIGSYSGQNASAGNEFYLGNQNYANNTDEKAKSLMYGQFNATPASQTLTINAATTSTYGLVGNNNGGDYDSYIKGLADDNLLYVDAGNDRVGIGTAAPTTKLEVNGTAKISSGDLSIATAGKGLAIKGGSNARIGTASLVAANSVTVTTTALQGMTTPLIFLTGQDGTDAFSVNNINTTAGTFDIVHSSGNATATIAWMIIETA